MIDTGCSGRPTCCRDTHSPYMSMGKEFLHTRLTQQSGGSPMDTHTSSLETGTVCPHLKRVFYTEWISRCLYTSHCVCADTGDTMRRRGLQTATSPSQTADGAGSLPHPKEPSSVMTAVNNIMTLDKANAAFIWRTGTSEQASFHENRNRHLKLDVQCWKQKNSMSEGGRRERKNERLEGWNGACKRQRGKKITFESG